ncbi:unnamed protein product [Rotaria sp. Silwood2]|nr:unnamed protein product [Rotaria sp. Silwood2]CAF4276296.1 unnamed protein product [Rotaria sp. Silwood2]
MSNESAYDPNEELPSPSIEVLNQMLGSYQPNIFDYRKTFTPTGIDASYHSSLNSPSESISLPEMLTGEDLPYGFDIIQCQPAPSFELRPEDEKLLILAEPKAFYRDRYSCEVDPTKSRAQRFIRAEDNQLKYEYPTVKIPNKWCDPTRQIYIQVTSVTILNELVPYHCIHPYEIDTQENNVIKDPENNSLYFRINEDEFRKGEKSFQISRKKMIQNDLKKYGPLRLFSSSEKIFNNNHVLPSNFLFTLDQPDTQRILNLEDAKSKITIYQLKKSQFIFTIAERHPNVFLPIPMPHTSVESEIMIDTGNDGRDLSMNSLRGKSNNPIKCIPQKGDWQGGDEIVIIMSKPIKRKVCSICFDFGLLGRHAVQEITHIDTKIILFQTPSYPIPPGDENIKVSVDIIENNLLLSSIDFYYMTPIKTTINLCTYCHSNMNVNHTSNKRTRTYAEHFENDSGESLVSQMQHLSIKKETKPSHIQASSDEKTEKLDKYLNQLKVALGKFIRTNDPSRLFRRTRILLSQCDENPPLLNDAIQRGHTQIALALIEQVLDMSSSQGLLEKENENGETPLLIAAKCNQWKLIEPIIKNRSDLVKHKDKNGNNLLHLLANLHDDEGAEVIKSIFKILPNEIKTNLLTEKNKNNQRPIDIAQSHGNPFSCELLIESEQ